MIISSTFIGLANVLDKFDDLAIEAAVAGIHFPPDIESEYKKLSASNEVLPNKTT